MDHIGHIATKSNRFISTFIGNKRAILCTKNRGKQHINCLAKQFHKLGIYFVNYLYITIHLFEYYMY